MVWCVYVCTHTHTHLDVTCVFKVVPECWLTDSSRCWLVFHLTTLADEVMERQAVEQKEAKGPYAGLVPGISKG